MAALMNDELLPGDSIFVPNYQPWSTSLPGPPCRRAFPSRSTSPAASQPRRVDTDAEVARILASRPRFIVLDRSEWFTMRASAMAMLTEALEKATNSPPPRRGARRRRTLAPRGGGVMADALFIAPRSSGSSRARTRWR
jgi:hypothetical protein